MANPNYQHWIKTENVEPHHAYTFNDASGQRGTSMRRQTYANARPNSSSSSLRGAMGDMAVSSSQYSGSPSPPSDHARPPTRSYDVASGMVWTHASAEQLPTHTQYAAAASMQFGSPTTSLSGSPTHNAYAQYQEYPINTGYATNQPSAQQQQPHQHASYGYQDQFDPQAMIASSSAAAFSAPRAGTAADELRQLRTRVRELELINESARLRIRELESELAHPLQAAAFPSASTSTTASGLPAPPPPGASFAASWKARTDARVRLFCSLNRAGNALCAWHDSRRERRAHPPRMAPPGTLNCGCTFEEALFEESLARHGVGSYHPGESVRMDPALRNPLLRLLQARFGYRDGDFERDPATGGWREGEGHAAWEAKALAGAASHRKHRVEERR